MDQTKNAGVGHAMLDELHRPFVGHVVEKAPNVCVQHPAHSLPLDSHIQRIQRLMRAATGPEPIRKSFEVHLINLIEDGHHRLLNNLVLQRRDAQRTLPPVGLRYIDSPRGLCPIRSPVHPAVQIGDPILQPGPYSCHVTPSTPGAAFRFNAKKLSRSRSTVRWCSRAVNCSCFLSFAACRTPLNPWDTLSPLCVGCVSDCAMFSLVRALPSPTSAADCSSLFGWFIGTTARSDSSAAYMSGVRLAAFADRPRSAGPDAPEVSRFSCMQFLSVRGVFDYAGPAGSRSTAAGRVAFLCCNRVRRPDSVFRSSIPGPPMPLSTLHRTPRDGRVQDSRPRWIRFLLSCRTLSFPTTCRFIPAHFR